MEKYRFNAFETEWWHYSWTNDRNYEVFDIDFKKLKKGLLIFCCLFLGGNIAITPDLNLNIGNPLRTIFFCKYSLIFVDYFHYFFIVPSTTVAKGPTSHFIPDDLITSIASSTHSYG